MFIIFRLLRDSVMATIIFVTNYPVCPTNGYLIVFHLLQEPLHRTEYMHRHL
jgi:hypothetical protein